MDANEHVSTIKKYIKPGDTITHARCMGCIEEHIFAGWDGSWLCGTATADTIRLNQWDESDEHYVNDISPRNITHINRVPVEHIALLSHQPEGEHTYE